MSTIDAAMLESYNAGFERGRLRTNIGLIEFARSKEVILENLPQPPAIIYDIGGGYGEYAWWLASLGYEVHLFDISETNIKLAGELKKEYPDCELASAEVADAVNIKRADKSADAILFMGPLYSIPDKEERVRALKECRRLLKDGGKLFSATITRYATLLWAISVYGKDNRLIEEDEFMKMVAHELATGEHIRRENSSYRGIGRSHFHSPEELKSEIAAAGFAESVIHGIVGAAWLAPNLDELWKNEASREALMNTVRLLDAEKNVVGLSTHLLTVSW